MRRVLGCVGLSGCLASVLAGCAFEHGDLGGSDDDPGSGSGSGAVQPGDFDGDGVADLDDNCNTAANADQRDHDDDGRGDRCDVCPHLPDAGGDSDGDGVGDACDPNPTTASDRIAFFDGFYQMPQWDNVQGPGMWQVNSGVLRQPKLEASQLVRDDDPDLGTVFVDARVQVNSMAMGPAARRSVGLVVGFGDAKHYFFCGVAQTQLGSEVQAGAEFTDFWGTAQYEYAPGAFASQVGGGWLTLQTSTSVSSWGGTHIDCMGHRGQVTGTAQFEHDGTPTGDIGLRTNGIDASFDYVFVVETAPSGS
ncbi:MAG TPA: thrombospondin type 3 repeat-containing protein [Kofleriaceae bacterium]|nr:thrombospondin type 3 repeat-containing protein [Kofleriaceae bacterium]